MPKRTAQAAGLSQSTAIENGSRANKRNMARMTGNPKTLNAQIETDGSDEEQDEEQQASSEDDDENNDDDDDDDDDDDEGGEDSDSEINEFEQDGDDQMIEDDDQDLHAVAQHLLDDDGEEDDDDNDDDDDDDADDAEVEQPVASTSTVPISNQRSKQKKPRQLTADELRALAFAELTASPVSNTISTRVHDLLQPVTAPPPTSGSRLQPLLKELHQHLTTNVAAQKPQTYSKLLSTHRKLFQVPSIEGNDSKWTELKLAFEKPLAQDVRIVGRWAWGGAFRSEKEYIVDLAIAMPQTLLQPKDFMAPRFAVKSAHYLVNIAVQLPSSLGSIRRSFVRLPGSQGLALELRADATATPKSGLGAISGAVIRIRAVWPADAFTVAKLNPHHNLARPSTVNENDQIDPTTLPSTPLRSTCLLLSSMQVQTAHLQFHHALTKAHSSYPAAVRLLQYWAKKRLYGNHMGMTDDWWAWCVARTLMTASSSHEPATAAIGGEAWAIWRKTLETIANTNWTNGVYLNIGAAAAVDGFTKQDFQKAFNGQALFVDPTGKINLAAGIEIAALNMLKQDAKATISLMLSNEDDETKFTRAFNREMLETERFDNFARITIPSSLVNQVSSDECLDFANKFEFLMASISATLQRALSNRVKAFQLIAPAPPSTEASTLVLKVGVLLDQVQSLRAVDQGPSAEDSIACADWSAFWGPKSELRRFKDGSILETVVWDEPGPNGLGPQRHTIVAQIIKYILNHRHGLDKVDVFAGALDPFMVENVDIRRRLYLEDPVASGKGFSLVMMAFDQLAKEIKNSENLPLEVSSVSPVSASLRYSSVLTPAPRRLKNFDDLPLATRYVDAHEFDIVFESSGRWPEDLEAVQKIKAAFLTKVAESLEQSRTVFSARIAFDLEARPIDDNVSIEILTHGGFAFRGRVSYERSLLLHQERVAQLGDSPEAIAPLETFRRRFVHLPKHHGAIASVQQAFTSYSHTVRLVKSWFNHHMLSDHFDEEQIELLCANAFIDPSSPYDPPQSGATGFARVMNTLLNWQFKDKPLFVPLYSFAVAVSSGRRAAFPPAKRDRGHKAFEIRRMQDKNVNRDAWFIATEEDVKSNVWGHKTSAIAAGRARALAAATLTTLNEGVVAGTLVPITLFNSPLKDYAFLIHIDPAVNPRHYQSSSPDSKAFKSSSSNIIAGSLAGQDESDEEDNSIKIEWDPVSDFVRDLETLYPSTFVLFHAVQGGSVIGGIWDPSVEGPPRSFKVGLGFPFKPANPMSKAAANGSEDGQGKSKVVINKKAILSQIERIGKGLVSRTEQPIG
ncbi:U3 snoRNP protein [Microbotryomycetes sp. JL221]|nr:U3 snoRNP protein [Microbotryomycetes sp. JL221]